MPAAIYARDPNIVIISTISHPVTGRSLISSVDNQRHYELFLGVTKDGGSAWEWRPITANSTGDNLRPIIRKGSDARRALIWMRGAYTTFRGKWNTAVVAIILPPGTGMSQVLAGNAVAIR